MGKLCPDLIFIPTNFEKYKMVANQTRVIFASYDQEFQACSLDEAYLDVTEYLASKNDPETSNTKETLTGSSVAKAIRSAIYKKTKLTASAGIACNKMLSKICSDLNKPNGQFCLPATVHSITTFMQKLSVRKIPGVGPVTHKMLKSIGINTCNEVLQPYYGNMLFELFSTQ